MTATAPLTRRMVYRPEPIAPTNNSGGPTHIIDVWNRLQRFLILGVEGGTYYVNEKTHIADNVAVVTEALNTDFKRAIHLAVEISEAGRAPKNDYAIYVLARGASSSLPVARRYALNHLNRVCRTGTHLFQFVEMVDKMRGWGPALRAAVSGWYLSKDTDSLAYQVLKYQNRMGWTHRDVFRKVHPITSDPRMNALFRYITHGVTESIGDAPHLVHVYEEAKSATNYRVADLVRRTGLSREMIPTNLLNDPVVATALTETSPYTALLRNLGNMTLNGGINEENIPQVTARLVHPDSIKKSRVHPISILIANRTYSQGGGYRSQKTWQPKPEIIDALDSAFSSAFTNIVPTGKRFLVGVDVSGSMSAPVNDTNLTSSEAAAALALQWVRTEPNVQVFGFDTNLIPLNITRRSTLNDAINAVKPWNYGGTDCAKLIQFALDHRIDTDVFVVITDNETNAGRRNPAQVLREYRQVMKNPDAALVVLATTASGFSIADPNDSRMLDIAGFDSAVPSIINEFISGNI